MRVRGRGARNTIWSGGGGKKHYGIENYDVEFGGGGSRRAGILAWRLDPLVILPHDMMTQIRL